MVYYVEVVNLGRRVGTFLDIFRYFAENNKKLGDDRFPPFTNAGKPGIIRS